MFHLCRIRSSAASSVIHFPLCLLKQSFSCSSFWTPPCFPDMKEAPSQQWHSIFAELSPAVVPDSNTGTYWTKFPTRETESCICHHTVLQPVSHMTPVTHKWTFLSTKNAAQIFVPFHLIGVFTPKMHWWNSWWWRVWTKCWAATCLCRPTSSRAGLLCSGVRSNWKSRLAFGWGVWIWMSRSWDSWFWCGWCEWSFEPFSYLHFVKTLVSFTLTVKWAETTGKHDDDQRQKFKCARRGVFGLLGGLAVPWIFNQ